MARKSMQELIALVNANIPTNGNGMVTAAKVREVFTEFISAISPAYAYMSIGAGVSKNITTAFTTLNFSSHYDSDITQTTSDELTGNISRSERGSSIIEFTASVELPANRILDIALFRNETQLPWAAQVQGRGTGNSVPVGISGIDYFDPAAVYSVKVKTDANTSVLFESTALILRIEPVNSFI